MPNSNEDKWSSSVRTAARVDGNHREIVNWLGRIGASVQSLAREGEGCPDILVGYKGKNYLFEIKIEKGKLNSRQQKWHSSWKGQVNVIKDWREAFEVIGVNYENK